MGSPWISPRSLFSKFFHGLLFGWTLLLFWPNFKFVALPFPEIIAIGVLGGVRTPIVSKDRPYGSGMVPLERALVSSIGPPSNFSSICTRFRDIAAFVLQRTTLSHPPLVSSKFHHIPLGVVGLRLGYEERRRWANSFIRAISFQAFQSM